MSLNNKLQVQVFFEKTNEYVILIKKTFWNNIMYSKFELLNIVTSSVSEFRLGTKCWRVFLSISMSDHF